MNYLQVITPGYLIVLEAQGRRYEYHADKRARLIRCEKPENPAAKPAPDTSPLANTAWRLESFGDPAAPTTALAEATITLSFDSAEHGVSGNSGCNSYGGTYQVDGSKLKLSQIVGTLMACSSQPLMDQETQYQQALGKVSQYAIDGDMLELTYDGTKVLRFRAASPTS
jgi:heat shock protein HslJ